MTTAIVSASYDDVAAAYDRLVRPRYERISALLVDRLTHDTGMGTADVVELSAGTGTLTHQLAPYVGSYLATDVSEPMMALGRACPAPACRRVVWQRADVEATGLSSAIADVVVSSLGPFQDTTAGRDEALRLLRPGGRLLAATWGDDYTELHVLQDARARLGLPPRSVTRVVEQGRRLHETGFADVDVHEVRLAVVHESPAAYIAYREAFGRLPETAVDAGEARRALAAAVAPYVDRHGRVHLDWQVLVMAATG